MKVSDELEIAEARVIVEAARAWIDFVSGPTLGFWTILCGGREPPHPLRSEVMRAEEVLERHGR